MKTYQLRNLDQISKISPKQANTFEIKADWHLHLGFQRVASYFSGYLKVFGVVGCVRMMSYLIRWQDMNGGGLTKRGLLQSRKSAMQQSVYIYINQEFARNSAHWCAFLI